MRRSDHQAHKPRRAKHKALAIIACLTGLLFCVLVPHTGLTQEPGALVTGDEEAANRVQLKPDKDIPGPNYEINTEKNEKQFEESYFVGHPKSFQRNLSRAKSSKGYPLAPGAVQVFGKMNFQAMSAAESVSVTADGSKIAVSTPYHHGIRIFDREGNPILWLRTRHRTFYSQISPDGRYLAALYVHDEDDRDDDLENPDSLLIYDLNDGVLIHTEDGVGSQYLSAVVWAPDSEAFALAVPGKLKLYNMRQGVQLIQELDMKYVTDMSVRADGQTLYALEAGALQLWQIDIMTGRRLDVLDLKAHLSPDPQGNTPFPYTFYIDDKAMLLYLGGTQGYLAKHDLKSGKLLLDKSDPKHDRVLRMRYGTDGLFVSTSHHRMVINASTLKREWAEKRCCPYTRTLDGVMGVSSDGTIMMGPHGHIGGMTCYDSKRKKYGLKNMNTLHFNDEILFEIQPYEYWFMTRYKFVRVDPLDAASVGQQYVHHVQAYYGNAHLTADREQVVTASVGSQIYIWYTKPRFQRRSKFKAGVGRVTKTALTHDKSKLLVTGYSGFSIWKADGSEKLMSFKCEVGDDAKSLVLDPTGKYAAFTSGDELHVVDIEQAKIIQSISSRFNNYGSIAWIMDGRALVAQGPNGYEVFLMPSGRQIRHKPLQEGQRVGAFDIHPNGRYVAIEAGFGFALLEVATGEEVLSAPYGHLITPQMIRMTPDGRYLFTISNDSGSVMRSLNPLDYVLNGRAMYSIVEARDWWDALSPDADAALSYRAIWSMTRQPDLAVKMLKTKLTPISRANVDIQKLVDLLDDPSVDVRDKATEDLRQRGMEAEPELRRALHETESLEKRWRVRELLSKLPLNILAENEDLQISRAISALEWIGDDAAMGLLKSLAEGGPGFQTQMAKASWMRLTQRRDYEQAIIERAKTDKVFNSRLKNREARLKKKGLLNDGDMIKIPQFIKKPKN